MHPEHRLLSTLAVGALLAAQPAPAYERLQGPTGVTYWDRAQTFTGYTFFGTQGTSWLIDLEGRVVHAWPIGNHPRLLDDGHVLDATNGALRELDWGGSNVWSHAESRTNYTLGADALRIFNPELGTNTTLYLAARTVTSNQCIAAGCNPAGGPYTNVTADAVVEVDASGAVIWEWCFFDHGCQNFDAAKANYIASISNAPGRLNLNLAGQPVSNGWPGCTSLDFNTNLNQIVLTCAGGEFYVIDHGGTFVPGNPAASIALAAGTNGDFRYRFGDPARHGQGSPPSIQLNWTTSTTGNKQIGGCSEARWIGDGLPGAGHLLVFNNGGDLFETTPQSYVFEINPFLNTATNDTGAYVNPPTAGYNNWTAPGHDTDKRTKSLSRQVVWMYYAKANQGLFSHLASSAQRLPNSNTLICAATEGHLLEVTAAGEAVWEYVSPVTATGLTAYKRDAWPMDNAVNRAWRIATNHPALTGRTLLPTTTISGAEPSYVSAPLIGTPAPNPAAPTAGAVVWVTAPITNRSGIAGATLTYVVSGSTNRATMFDDGLHGDGAAGDGVYGTQVPAQATGTLVSFVVAASNEFDLTSTAASSYTVQAAPTKPNILIVVTDDHGWNDISAHGGPAATPNMDRLGSEGIRLERFYATPVCSVTRSALLTGRNPIRTSVNNSLGLDLQEQTLPQSFKAAGYQTFMCGKWHLGGLYNTESNTVINGATVPVIRENIEYQPQNRGWDIHYGPYTGAIGYTNHVSQETGQPDWWLNGQTNTDAGWSTELLADKAVQLIQTRDTSKPVLLYLAFNAVHGPVSAPTNYLSKYLAETNLARRTTLAALDQMDTALGRVLDALDTQGIASNTIVVFFGDNGGQASTGGSNLPLRGDKGDLFDGGIHTPAAIRWPGVLPSGVTNCQQFVWVGDWFPTLCTAAGVVSLNTHAFDGVDMWPLLLAATNGAFNPSSYRGGPLLSGSSAGSAVFGVASNGNGLTMFKLVHDKLTTGGYTNWLFDIISDPLETNDLSAAAAYTNHVATLATNHDGMKAEAYSPYIGVHPQSQSAAAGSNVTLWAMATVYPKTLACQWRKNGTNILGATNRVEVDTSVYLSRLDLSSVTSADAAAYDLVVTDAAVGWPLAATSLTAVLTVDTNAGSAIAYDLLLGRPTATSIAVSVMADTNITVYLEYGTLSGALTNATAQTPVTGGVPVHLDIGGLAAGQRHYYRLRYSATGGAPFATGPERTFVIRRASGSSFVFDIEADPHYGDPSATISPALWQVALTNILADQPDFLVDLGDTFMDEKVGATNSAGVSQLRHDVRRNFFSIPGHSVPLYLATGNHDAELGWLLDGTASNLAAWGAAARPVYFPCPTTNSYYAFDWGDALFVVLDPFWYTASKPATGPNIWSWTLGTNQYAWLRQTLTGSTARFKFVFIHHLVGGSFDGVARGGVEYAKYGEWGGFDTNGTWGFDTQRPGWPATIEQLLLSNRVQAVFHGHDHLYVRQEQDADGDGIADLLYQECPQPSALNYGSTATAAGYGYTNGVILGNSGHLRVTVTPATATVEYVRAYLPADEGSGQTNRMISQRYTIAASVTGAWTMAALPDTGQTQSFTTVTGEDADYLRNPPAFTNNGDGTVRDLVTGLTWQQADSGEMAWTNALLYAQTNRVGGFSDWRLPTAHEAFTLLHHGRVNPALDTNVFTASMAQYWWTADPQMTDSGRVWAVNAGGGIGAHRLDETISSGGSNRYHARCVRGVALAGRPVHHFTNNLDGTVTDLDTGLVWQRVANTNAFTWESALQYAESLSLAGRTDWRLPNIKELHSLNDETRASPSADTNYFAGTGAQRHWSSTTVVNLTNRAWNVDFQLGLVSYEDKTSALNVRCVRGGVTNAQAAAGDFTPQFAYIPAGRYLMGDHFGFVDPLHPTDEMPLHTVYVDSFYMETTLLTCWEYGEFLNSALAQGLVEVRSNYVYGVGGTNIYCDTYGSDTNSRIQWAGGVFSIRDSRDLHPITGVRWFGAIAYCNWASARDGLSACYDLATGGCMLTNGGYRLPTEAEWEYAGRGGLYSPYGMFPWGSDTNADGTLANWAGKANPFAAGAYPWTTPVGFYNGSLRTKADFGWPGTNETYQTRNNANGFGLYDMSGNVWEWINDWYASDYYTNCVINGIVTNPPGPAAGSPMPDGKPYRGLRGGNWFNGEDQYGHGRVANRDPSYFRGPGDPNGPWFHVGFRVIRRGHVSVLATNAVLTQRASGLHFTESPAADASGNVFFSDIPADTIYRWSVTDQLSVFRTNSGGANGLFFDVGGNLLACEGDNGRLVSISPQTSVTAVAVTYGGQPFNEPNDLWIDPEGGVYFTDPVFFSHPVVQGGEHVYYLKPDRSAVIRVASDLTRPNGLVGTPGGTTLYIADWGATNVFRYSINPDGTLTNKSSFARVRCDGMTMDGEGHLYFTEAAVLVYDPRGSPVEQINVPDRPTNLEFGGSDRKTLFITTETGSLYSVRMRVQGAVTGTTAANQAPVIANTAISPAAPTSNDIVWVTARITDDAGVASATLMYNNGSLGSSATNTVFLETMRSAPLKPWTGDGCNNPWTNTYAGGNPFEQRGGAHYGTGNTNGLEFKNGTANLTDSMVWPTQVIDARGTSGSLEFWMWADGLSGTAGWTFQAGIGTSFVTRVSELTGSNHLWQLYHYDLQPSELVSNLAMRFQFRGGLVTNRVDLDQISVKVVTSGSSWSNVTMLDDGSHQDGAAGDGIYGAQIPPQPTSTTVFYYLSAADGAGASVTQPSGAPATTLTYTVQGPPAERTVGLVTNTASAYPGFTLMAPMHFTNTYLINNAGEWVHRWSSAYEPGRSAFLLTNGHLIRACMTRSGGPSTGGGEGGRIEEQDWSGNLVWAIDYYSPNYIHHHDFKVLPNGNVLLLVAEKKTYAEVVAAGFNTNLLDTSIVTDGYMLPDYLVEVTPTPPYGGTVVWEWHIWDHMIQDYSPARTNYGVVADHPELIDVNGTGIKIPQFWNHVNGIDYNAELDQVMISVRGNSELFVVDHQLTTAQAAGHSGGRYGKGGDILYRWGYAQQYDRGTAADRKLYQQHHTHWIEPGLPGAGRILIFNNGIGRSPGYSSVDEIAPPVLAGGSYTQAPGAAFGPTSTVWTYVGSPPTNFCSSEISGAERLPNGNTLICEGIKGNLFEVSTNGQIVWQYVCPVTTGVMTQGESPPVDPARTDQFLTAVFRVNRYATIYAGLAGKDLTPRGPIEVYSGQPADADGDGMSDIWEIRHFTNTAAAGPFTDSDGDGLSDAIEYLRGLHPRMADTDGDGIPDGWEAGHSMDPAFSPDSAWDSDSDGFTAYSEYLADTDPGNPYSFLGLLDISATGGATRITWHGGTSVLQYLQRRIDLAATGEAWVVVYTGQPPTAVTNLLLDQAPMSTTRIYRIQAVRP